MNKVNVVIPMAGAGKRFLDQGYKLPKPLLEVGGKTMIEWVIKSVDFPQAHFIFLIRKDHDEQYRLGSVLKKIKPDSDIIVIDKLTEGAICTVLLAEKLINNDTPVIIKDCDQIIDWTPQNFMRFVKRHGADGAIVTVITEKSNYSFAKVSKQDYKTIIETAEKVVISNLGASGVYYFGKGRDLVKYGKQMIAKNIRVNNEFYVCPVYNEFIEDGKKIVNYPVADLYGLNTPEEFEQDKLNAIRIFDHTD